LEYFYGITCSSAYTSLTQEHSYEVSSPNFLAQVIPNMLVHSPEEKIQLVPHREHSLQPL